MVWGSEVFGVLVMALFPRKAQPTVVDQNDGKRSVVCNSRDVFEVKHLEEHMYLYKVLELWQQSVKFTDFEAAYALVAGTV